MTEAEPRLALRKDDLVWQVVEGDIVALDFPARTYFATNGTGAVLWELLRHGTTRAELITTMRDRYRIGADQAATEVDEFLSQLAHHGLLA